MSEQSPLDRATEFLSAGESDEARRAEVDDLGDRVIEALRTVYDPEIPVNIFELGLVYKVDVDDDNTVQIDMTLTSPMCPVAGSLPPDVEARIRAIPGVTEAKVEITWDPAWGPEMMTEAARLQLNML